jgi:hypothetical protein
MQRFIVFRKMLFAFLTVAIYTVFSMNQVSVNATDSKVDGAIDSYGYNNPATVSQVRILEDDGLTSVATISRIDNFFIEFQVRDIDGFENLDVYIALYNNDESDKNDDSGLLKTFINSGYSDEALVLRWVAKERATYLVNSGSTTMTGITTGENSILVKSGSNALDFNTANSGLADFVTPAAFTNNSGVGGHTWEVIPSGLIASYTVIESGLATTLSGTTVIDSGVRNLTYNVRIPFRMSKVAPSSGVWNVGVYVQDLLQIEKPTPRTNIVEYEDGYATSGITNLWYGELSIQSQNSIVFDDVEAGSGFHPSTDTASVLFISNGVYTQQFQTDTTWTPDERIPTRPIYAYLISDSGMVEAQFEDPDYRLGAEGNRFALQVKRVSLDGDTGQAGEWVSILLPTHSYQVLDGESNENFVPDITQSGANTNANNQFIYRQNDSSGVVQSAIAAVDSADKTSEVWRESLSLSFQLRNSQVFQEATVYTRQHHCRSIKSTRR